MKYEDNLIRERVLKLMHREGVRQIELADIIGRNQGNISLILAGKRPIPKGFTTDVIKAFPKVNKEWLLFGEGTMYEGDAEVNFNEQLGTRPRLPKSMSGGHLTEYFEGDKRQLCQEKPIITQFPDYDFTLILKNNRMSPKYDRGDEIAFKRSSIIEWGNDYLLDTEEGPKFKKIYECEDGVRCVSYNHEEFPDFVVPMNKIFGFYRCVGVLRIM